MKKILSVGLLIMMIVPTLALPLSRANAQTFNWQTASGQTILRQISLLLTQISNLIRVNPSLATNQNLYNTLVLLSGVLGGTTPGTGGTVSTSTSATSTTSTSTSPSTASTTATSTMSTTTATSTY